jgi:hypothetical protein
MHRSLLALAMLAGAAGCVAREPSPSVELIPVPNQSRGPILQLGPPACPGALLEGTLVRHQEAGLAVQGDPQFPPHVVVWPHGWVAREADGVLEILDDLGRVIGREGDHFWAGGGYYPPNDWFHPCGQIEITADPPE